MQLIVSDEETRMRAMKIPSRINTENSASRIRMGTRFHLAE